MEKLDTRKKMRRYLAKCRAGEELVKIEAQDMLFKENNQSRFRSFTSHVECKGLRINESICTDPQEIVNSFQNHFKELATSSPSLLEAESIIPDLEHSSFLNCENILDADIELDEVQGALRT